jgi:hypothetical protein
MQRKSCPQQKKKVIVRAWGDEPVMLFLYSIENTTAYVGREDSDTVIGLPLEQVFLFNESAFSSLRGSFESRDLYKLESTYAELLVNSPCNRYQDTLESPHDQKHITDSRSVASSREQ